MDQGRVSVSYAKALLHWAIEKGAAQEVYSQSVKLRVLLDSDPDVMLLLTNPMASLSKRVDIFSKVLKDYTPNLIEFVSLILRKQRGKNLKNILLVFERIYREKFGVIKCIVESSSELGEGAKKSIGLYLEQKYKKSVELEFVIKPEIIGGFILTIEDKLLDKSVKGELEKFRKQLMGMA